VATREPNALGLFDFHGNVWEWCEDDYAADFYGRAPLSDPINYGPEVSRHTHKVSRGGGFLALAEMCRTRFRLHDPAEFWAPDLGFRLARSEG
jgi:formylglycine-generating enzyme required for sulfatase activity